MRKMKRMLISFKAFLAQRAGSGLCWAALARDVSISIHMIILIAENKMAAVAMGRLLQMYERINCPVIQK